MTAHLAGTRFRYSSPTRYRKLCNSGETVGGQAAIARDDLTMASGGLGLAEAREVLSGIQHHLITAQAAAAAVAERDCGSCGRARASKDTRHIRRCRVAAERGLPARPHPAGHRGPPTGRAHRDAAGGRTLRGAVQLHRHLPAEWEELPRPGLPLVVTLDGGYVHSSHQMSRKTAGSRRSPAPTPPPTGPPRPSPTCRPTTPSPSAGCTSCCARRGCRTPAGRVPHRRRRGRPRP